MMRLKLFVPAFALLITLSSCSIFNNVNFFSVEQDAEFGAQVAKEIESNPSQYPILPEKGNEQIYSYIRGLRNQILNSGTIKHRDEFAWDIKIIDDDNTLNAFCTPGGYIYVYTGLIKFLDTEDQLIGVIGHEIAHADMRHSTKQLSKTYGSSMLLGILLGDNYGMLQDIAVGISGLAFSRSDEKEADSKSVEYLCKTKYNAAGAAGFFQKMEGQSTPPEFLSTHPNPGDRVKDINAKRNSLGCSGNDKNQTKYNQMKALI